MRHINGKAELMSARDWVERPGKRHRWQSPVVCLLFLVSVASSLAMELPPRYQSIIDRKPFGVPPVVKARRAQPVQPVKPGPVFTKGLRMCGITEGANFGIRVVIFDVKKKKTYFFSVGDIDQGDDLALVSADFEDKSAVLRRDDKEETIRLEGSTAGRNSPTTAGSTSGVKRIASSRTPRKSYAQRLKERRDSVRHRETPTPKLKGEELRKHLESYQMDVIRQGLPPLPIPLTVEMDAVLVKEGVLPPQE